MIATLSEAIAATRSGYWGGDPGEGDVDVRVIRNGDISTELGIAWDRCPIRGFTHGEAERSEVRLGDILVTTSGDCGKVSLVGCVPPARYCASNFIRVIRPCADVEPRFLYWWLRSPETQRQMTPFIRGTTLKNFSFTNFAEATPFRAPPVEEQRRLADVLDTADAIRRKRKEAITLTDDLLRSAFLEMFGDPVTNTKGWPVAPLADLAHVTTGNTPSRAISEYFGDAIEWIKSDNINTPSHFLTPAEEGLSAKGKAVGRIAPAGSSLVTCIAGSPGCIGNVALADRDVAFNQQINAVTPKTGVDHRFMYVLLLVGKRLVQAASTNSMKGMVSKGRLEEVRVPSPPGKLQETFGRTFDAVLGTTRREEAAHAESEHLLHSLLHRAFRQPAEAVC